MLIDSVFSIPIHFQLYVVHTLTYLSYYTYLWQCEKLDKHWVSTVCDWVSTVCDWLSTVCGNLPYTYLPYIPAPTLTYLPCEKFDENWVSTVCDWVSTVCGNLPYTYLPYIPCLPMYWVPTICGDANLPTYLPTLLAYLPTTLKTLVD